MPPSPPRILDVADTALMVAGHRALESARPDALFVDPLAGYLVGERGLALAERTSGRPMRGWQVEIRTVVIDTMILDAVAGGVARVLNLGAGLDTRPYRLELPSEFQWIEADQPPLLAEKARALADRRPRCQLERRDLDLGHHEGVQRFMAELGDAPTLVLTEGVIPYLSSGEAGALAAVLRDAPWVRGWIVDLLSPQAVRSRRLMARFGKIPQLAMRFDPEDWLAFFDGHGWIPAENRHLGVVGMRLGRPPPIPWVFRVLTALGASGRGPSPELLRHFGSYARLERRGDSAV